MPNLLHFSPLGSRDAKRIARLQRRLFAPELTESVAEIRQILDNTEQHLVCNMSFGLFDDTEMVGYLFAYVESTSLFHEREEELIYLKEIALLPGYESQLRQLFFKLYEQWVAFTPGLPLEAHVLDEALAKWRRLLRLSAFFGLTLTDTKEVRRAGRPPYNLLRMDVAQNALAIYDKPASLPAAGVPDENDVSVSVITDPRQWLSLEGVWNTLLHDTPDSSVFQSFDYLWQWWRHFGHWHDLHIVVFRRGQTVIGVAPLMREYFPVFGKTVRNLVFITAPMEMSRPKLLFGNNDDACWPAFTAWLQANTEEWDILDLDEQRPNRMTRDLREQCRQQRWLVAESETVCPYILVEGSWKTFMSGLTRRMRSNVQRMRRRLAEAGDIRVRIVSAWPELDRGLDIHCEIESRSWKAAKELDLASDRGHYYYYKRLAQVFSSSGSFEQRILECDGEPIASTFGILRDGVFQSLKIAHDSEYDRYSPGTVLESYELEDLFGRRIACYEFMGSFLANKLRWTSTIHKTENIHVYQRRPRLALFYFVFFVVKRRVVVILKATNQFERVDRLMKKLRRNPFPRY